VTAPGKADLRLLAEAHAENSSHISRGRHLHGHLDGADVAGLLDHALHGQRAVVVRVADGEPVMLDAAGRGVDHVSA
jgi:hypothetical protein